MTFKRFWQLVQSDYDNVQETTQGMKTYDDCVDWNGRCNAGCGQVEFRVHWLCYLADKGEVGWNRMIGHRCDNTLCVRPDHLYAHQYGYRHVDRSHKLDGIDKQRIATALNGGERAIDLAEQYGVTATTIYRTRNKICKK